MRGGRSFILMLVVAAGLGAYIYFVEMKRDPAADTDTPAREKVFTLAPGSVDDVTITNATAETTRATRKDTTWSLVAPEALEADEIEVSRLVSAIETLERVKVIEENPTSVEPFGLAPPRIRVAFKAAGDAAPKVLHIGNKTPTGGDLYARVEGAPAVFLIGGFLDSTFNRKPFELREKTALKFARDDVSAITLAQGPTRVVLTKDGAGWKLATGSRADGAAVDALIGQLSQAKMMAIEPSGAQTKLRDYGLDKPQALVTVAAGSSKAELALGKKESESLFYARDLSRPLVFKVEQALVDELLKKPDDFRVKDVFEYRSFSALGMGVTFGGVEYTFAKSKRANAESLEHWSQTAPATTQPLDEKKFEDFLMTMSNLRAESFAATPITGGESVTITARFGDAGAPKIETVTLRKSGNVVHATRAGEPGAAVVSTADFDRAIGLFKEITSVK